MSSDNTQLVSWAHAADRIQAGGIGVLPTDTLYGLVASALDREAVARVYAVRQRDLDKPLITLIADISDLARFGIVPDAHWQTLLAKVWPGPVTLIFPCDSPAYDYLHRNAGGVSFRLPAHPELRKLLAQTGPIVAPSANPQGDEPARTVAEAIGYFGDQADFYVDGGELAGAPSAIVDGRSWPPRILRPAPGFSLN